MEMKYEIRPDNFYRRSMLELPREIPYSIIPEIPPLLPTYPKLFRPCPVLMFLVASIGVCIRPTTPRPALGR